MLKTLTFKQLIIINFMLCSLWHVLCFLACIFIKESRFSPDRLRYKIQKWEKGGKWYVKYLRIKDWKDLLPQYIMQKGFSKQHFTNLKIEYIDRFLMETCRAEWDHSMNCMYAVISIIINPLGIGLLFAFLSIFVNLPFIAIQRYNRTRLLTVKKKVQRSRRNIPIPPGNTENA